MEIPLSNDPQSAFDTAFAVRCPHCGVQAGLSAVSIPRFEALVRYRPTAVGIGYRCNSCGQPVFLRFDAVSYGGVLPVNGQPGKWHGSVRIADNPVEIQHASEDFEFKYLPAEVSDDFREALVCYSDGCLNAFAAMCRRSVQSAATSLGVEGTTKVQNQLNDLKATGAVDGETFDVLWQVVLSGHDGAHPHLPKMTAERAAVLLELMKDTMYQLFVRQAKIKEAMALRKGAAEAGKSTG